MQEFDDLKKRYDALPADIRTAIDSVETAEAVEKIALDNELMLDQADVLSTDIGYVMLGAIHSREFVSRIMKDLEINREKADKIAAEINTEIFEKIRASLQKIQIEESNTSNQDIEKAGDFTIEREAVVPEVTNAPMNRERVLNAIENPSFQNTKPINVLEAVSKNDEMADHMLSGTVAKPMTTTEVKPAAPISSKPAPQPQKQRPGADPYREPLM